MDIIEENDEVDDQSSENPAEPSGPAETAMNNDDQSSLYYVDERFRCWSIIAVVTVVAVVMLYFHIKQLFYIKNFRQKSTDQEGPLSIILGVLTNVATAADFGKPYAPAVVSIFGFIASVFICLALPGLWGWCERLMVIVLPLVVGGNFFWLRHRARAR